MLFMILYLRHRRVLVLTNKTFLEKSILEKGSHEDKKSLSLSLKPSARRGGRNNVENDH
jgi:hypothetical protein